MQLRLTNPDLIADLRQHFERPGFITNRVNDETVEARKPDAADPEQERRDVKAHLTVWNVMHPSAAEIDDRQPPVARSWRRDLAIACQALVALSSEKAKTSISGALTYWAILSSNQ